MRHRIGFLVSSPLYDFMQELLPELEQYCIPTVYGAESNEHVSRLYRQHWHRHDVFICSGRVFYLAALSGNMDLPRPCFAFDDLTGDIRDILLRLLIKNRGFDFSRMYVDIAFSKNNYLGIKELLPPGQWPHFGDDFDPDFPENFNSENFDRLTEDVFDHHLRLHREGRVDISITRFGALVSRLQEAGIPTVYMLPTREYVINLVLQVIHSLSQPGSRENMLGVLRISFVDGPEARNVQMARTGRAILEFAGSEGYDFSMVRGQDSLEFLTTYRDLERLTEGFSRAGFKGGLIPEQYPTLMGLGAGKNLYQARLNASGALDMARGSAGKVFFLDVDNVVIGPLGHTAPAFDRVPSDAVQQMARQLHINHANLQKIFSYTRLKDSYVVTAEELAEFLDVTVRSASRLLSKIQEHGGANAFSENSTGVRGRPRSLYELTFARRLEETENNTKEEQ